MTHIHLDHSGAIGRMANLFKDAVIICHKTGIPHLINPKTLWEGSLKTLNKIAEFYGKPEPVSDNTSFAPDISELLKKDIHNIRLINTLGHSSHHMSISIDDYMFLGEAAGVLIKFPSDNIYMRPATPPPFFIETYLHSIHLIMKAKPKLLCYAHLSIIDSRYMTLDRHCEQIELWMLIIREMMLTNKENSETILIKKCMKKLLEEDPFLHPIEQMDKQVQDREFFFIKNSIRGFIQNISKNK